MTGRALTPIGGDKKSPPYQRFQCRKKHAEGRKIQKKKRERKNGYRIATKNTRENRVAF